MTSCQDLRSLLNARLDEEIDGAQCAAFDLHIAECPFCSGALERLHRVRKALHGSMRYRPAPDGLREQVQLALRGATELDRRSVRPLWGSFAAAVLFGGLLSAPFIVNQRNQSSMLTQEFLSAHARALMGRDVDVVSSDNHTVKPWFNGRLPFSPPVIDLASEGFPLEGARLDSIGGHPVAALVYRRRLHRIDVFIRLGSEAPADFDRNGFTGLSWTKNSFVFTAVSDLNAAELRMFSSLMAK